MLQAHKNISADTKRSILQHLMFGVLGLLILMNWTVHRPLDYEMFNEAFVNSERNELEQQSFFRSIITDLKEEEALDFQIEMDSIAKRIGNITDGLILQILTFDSSLNASNYNSARNLDLKKCDSILEASSRYYQEVLVTIGIDTTAMFAKNLPINRKSIEQLRYLMGKKNLPFQNKSVGSIRVMLSTLKNDILISKTILLNLIFERVHEYTGYSCGGFKVFAFTENSFYVVGQKVIAPMSICAYYYTSGKRFLRANTNKGNIDDSTLRSDAIVLWEDKALELGLNYVQGNVLARYAKQNISEPFSFSYFVSAPGIAFHLDKANLCYVAVPNPISISVPGYPADKIKLKVADAKVSKTGDGRFEVFFSKIPSNKVYAYVEATNEQGRTSTVHSIEIKVKELPLPTTNLSSFKESGISLEELKNLKSIMVQPVDAAFDLEYEVISFQVEGITGDGKYIEPITVCGDEFSNKQELMSVFNAATVGDRFIFSNIHAKATNGKEYEALPVSILLK